MEKAFNFEEEVFNILFKHCPPLLEVQAREIAKEIADIVEERSLNRTQKVTDEK